MLKDGVKESEGKDYKTNGVISIFTRSETNHGGHAFPFLEKESISKMIWSWNFRAEVVNSFFQFILFLLL